MNRGELLALLRLLPGLDVEWAVGEAQDALLGFIDDREITEAFEAVSE